MTNSGTEASAELLATGVAVVRQTRGFRLLAMILSFSILCNHTAVTVSLPMSPL